MKIETKPYEEKMQKTVATYEKEFSTIRAGRANPAVLDKVKVDYYGTPTPINGAENDNDTALGRKAAQGDRKSHPRFRYRYQSQ